MNSISCPHCAARMDYLAHGFCTHCGKFCGCSWCPTSLNDYCDAHRPVLEPPKKVRP